MKEVNIVPLPINSTSTSLNDIRSIFLINTVAKVMETIIGVWIKPEVKAKNSQ